MKPSFTAYVTPWCVHCNRLVTDFAGDSSLAIVDVSEIAGDHDISVHPTIIATCGGQEIARTVGYNSKQEVLDWMDRTQARALLQAGPPDPVA